MSTSINRLPNSINNENSLHPSNLDGNLPNNSLHGLEENKSFFSDKQDTQDQLSGTDEKLKSIETQESVVQKNNNTLDKTEETALQEEKETNQDKTEKPISTTSLRNKQVKKYLKKAASFGLGALKFLGYCSPLGPFYVVFCANVILNYKIELSPEEEALSLKRTDKTSENENKQDNSQFDITDNNNTTSENENKQDNSQFDITDNNNTTSENENKQDNSQFDITDNNNTTSEEDNDAGNEDLILSLDNQTIHTKKHNNETENDMIEDNKKSKERIKKIQQQNTHNQEIILNNRAYSPINQNNLVVKNDQQKQINSEEEDHSKIQNMDNNTEGENISDV